MEKPAPKVLDARERITDPYALATVLLFFACALNFFSAALDRLGLVSVWDPDPETTILVAFGAAFLLQSAAVFCAVKFYREGIGRSRNVGGLFSLATLAILTLGILLDGGY